MIEEIASKRYGLCVGDCDFLEDKTIWVAVLSNGLTVYQDDNRSGKEAVAWKRLFDYCQKENVEIIGMHLKFRSHLIPMPCGDDVQGYYFCYGAHKEFDETITKQHYICGVLSNDRLEYSWYQTPELILTREHSRNPKNSDVKDKRLILNRCAIT